jgi:hypothetical protein
VIEVLLDSPIRRIQQLVVEELVCRSKLGYLDALAVTANSSSNYRNPVKVA